MRALKSAAAIALVALAFAALSPAALAAPLDDLAVDFAKLQLEVDVHDRGYVDAYYGPPEWQTEAEARKPRTAALKAEAARLIAAAKAVDPARADAPGDQAPRLS